MKQIIFPLSQPHQNDSVADLHIALGRLGLIEPVTQEELAEMRYAEGTAEAIRRVQAQFGIEVRIPGEVDEPTAEAINRALMEQGVFRFIEGRVVDEDDSPVAGKRIFAFDRDNIGGAFLAETITNADGAYRSYYDPLMYSRPGRGVLVIKEIIDLIVQVYDETGATLAESDPLRDPAIRVNVDLRVIGRSAEDSFVVRGQIVGTSGPQNRIEVTAFDRDLLFRREALQRWSGGQRLGTALTRRNPANEEDGWFEISYRKSDFQNGDIEPGEGTPDLVFGLSRNGELLDRFQVFRLPDGNQFREPEAVSERDLILGIPARKVEEVRIVLRDEDRSRRPSEYELIWKAIEPLLTERMAEDASDSAREKAVCIAAESFDEERHLDVSFVVRETGLNHSLVTQFASACSLSVKFRRDVLPAVFYGLSRSEGIVDARGLAAATTASLDGALRRASASSLIPPMEDADLIHAVETIRLLAPELLLEEPLNGSQSALKDVLAIAVESPAEKVELLRLAADSGRSAKRFWQSVREHEGLGGRASQIKYALELSAITQNNLPLVQKLKSNVVDATSTRSLAFYLDRETLTSIIEDPAVALPDEIPAETDEKRRELYAEAMIGILRNAQPTASAARVAKGIAATEDGALKVSPAAAKFLERAALESEDFDLATSRASEFKDLLDGDEQTKTATIREVHRIQRLFRISTGEENLSGLLRGDFHSAFHITQTMSGQGFVQTQSELLGGEAQAELAYRRALAVSSANLFLAVDAFQSKQGVSPVSATRSQDASDGQPVAAEAVAAAAAQSESRPVWAEMFGTAAMCECGHCRSWLSPAAYFVDLLLFLNKRHTAAQLKTPLEVLLSRRPDLQHLKLSCENTDTALPYIDLVNEVLESYIALEGVLDASSAHDVIDETSAELCALPQHVEAKAYEVLSNGVYPMELPFNRPLEIERAYLQQLGARRDEIIEAFEGSFGAADVAKRREGLSESLKISAREYEILTGTDFTGAPKQEEIFSLYGIGDSDVYKPLKIGDSGAPVVALRAKLARPGEELMLTGAFDEQVEDAVKEFQQAEGLPVTGQVDNATWEKLKPLGADAKITAVSYVPEFQKRTGLDFVKLVELLKCRFINPSQELYEKLEGIYATFGIDSSDVRAFAKTGLENAEASLIEKLLLEGKTPEDLKSAIEANFTADRSSL